jgi:hypothetical protein
MKAKITYEDFVMNEYAIYKTTTDDPMEFDDFVAGSDYLLNLYKCYEMEAAV